MLEAHTGQMDIHIGIIFMVRSSSMKHRQEWIFELTCVCVWGRFCLLLDGKESRVVDPLRQPERRREAGLDALGGEPTLALIPAFPLTLPPRPGRF